MLRREKVVVPKITENKFEDEEEEVQQARDDANYKVTHVLSSALLKNVRDLQSRLASASGCIPGEMQKDTTRSEGKFSGKPFLQKEPNSCTRTF